MFEGDLCIVSPASHVSCLNFFLEQCWCCLKYIFTDDVFLFNADGQTKNDGHTVLSESGPLEAESQMNKSCEHSSNEEKEANEDEGTTESDIVASDRSSSRPLLSDSEEEEEQGQPVALCSSLCSIQASTQPPTSFHQPPPSTSTQNHSQHAPDTGFAADVFPKAPFRIGQEETGDVFANAPFHHPAFSAQQQPDVFSQAPFGKCAEHKTSYPHTAGAQSATPDQVVLVQMAQQPFRPQALAKYSRHFEGSVPQQRAAGHTVVSNNDRVPAVASIPVGPLPSWTSDVSTVDPFISAPFHLKAPQKKPWLYTESSELDYAHCNLNCMLSPVLQPDWRPEWI